jgi:hypothetical protein
MSKSSKVRNVLIGSFGFAMLGLVGTGHAATYAGNGATGFGGPLGNGNLAITSTAGGNITFTLNNAGGFSGNDVVVYIDSIAGGFADTSQFSDNGDGGRQAISGANNGNPSRNLITFPAGFGADYALEFENDTFDGLFGLVAGGNNSLNFVAGNGPSTIGGPYVVTVPEADLGITPGQSFGFVGYLTSTSAYGSNEAIGTAAVIPDVGAAPNAGFNGQVIFASGDSYTTTAVPEPASLGLLGGMTMMLFARRRKA